MIEFLLQMLRVCLAACGLWTTWHEQWGRAACFWILTYIIDGIVHSYFE
jgi:hypothetical protein